MKKILMTMAMLVGITAGAMMFSSFATPEKQVKKEDSQLVVSVPRIEILYEGRAWLGHVINDTKTNAFSHMIKVYQFVDHPNKPIWICVEYDPDEGIYYLKENPRYNPNSDKVSEMKYYFTYDYDGEDYFFDM